jgi:hypothetical protein
MQMTPRNAQDFLACWSTGNSHKQQTEQQFLPPAVVWTEAHVHPDVIPVSKTIRYISAASLALALAQSLLAACGHAGASNLSIILACRTAVPGSCTQLEAGISHQLVLYA